MLKQVSLFLALTLPAVAHATDLQLRTTPCRLYDSRNIGAGAKITSATILTWGNAGASQGGESGCGAPQTAAGVVVNVISFEATTPGHGRLWPYQVTEPLASSINVTATLAENTGLMVSLGTDGKLSWRAVYSGHLVIDLAGWLDGGGDGAHQAPRARRIRNVAGDPFIPGTLAAGDRFLILPSGATGDFSGHSNEWVYWTGTAWVFEAPADGDLAYSSVEGIYYRYKGSGTPEWRAFEMSPGPTE